MKKIIFKSIFIVAILAFNILLINTDSEEGLNSLALIEASAGDCAMAEFLNGDCDQYDAYVMSFEDDCPCGIERAVCKPLYQQSGTCNVSAQQFCSDVCS